MRAFFKVIDPEVQKAKALVKKYPRLSSAAVGAVIGAVAMSKLSQGATPIQNVLLDTTWEELNQILTDPEKYLCWVGEGLNSHIHLAIKDHTDDCVKTFTSYVA